MRMKKLENFHYANILDSLMYVMMCTGLDIYYSVGLFSIYQSDPKLQHQKAVKRILRYLKGTTDYSLCYQGNDLQLKGYTNVNWGAYLNKRKQASIYESLLMMELYHGVEKKQQVQPYLQ